MMFRSRTRMLARAAIAAGLSLALAMPAAAGSLNESAQQMFDDLGVVGNVTQPQAFRGQTLNTYTGGSLFVRSPTKSYQLAAFSAPYIKAGCGGIDIYGGSFSHIASQEFKNLLRNITSALPAMIFNMLLASVEPLFETEIKWFRDAEAFVNQANISSCEAAQQIIGVGANLAGFNSNRACQTVSTWTGQASDANEARDLCQDSAGVNNVFNAAGANPATADMVPFEGNLVWSVLKQWPHLDDQDRELIMSITGTTLYERAVDGASEPKPYIPTVRGMADLLQGNTNPAAPIPAGSVAIKLLRCANLPDCTAVNETVVVQPSLTTRVVGIMRSLSDKIATASAAPTPAEVAFVNSVPLPVYQLLAASNAVNNAGIAEAKINQYAEYVAIEFAHALLARAARMGTDVALLDNRFDTNQRGRIELHRGAALTFLGTIQAERQVAEQKAHSFVAFATDVAQLKRTMRANMPQQLADLLSYAGISTR